MISELMNNDRRQQLRDAVIKGKPIEFRRSRMKPAPELGLEAPSQESNIDSDSLAQITTAPYEVRLESLFSFQSEGFEVGGYTIQPVGYIGGRFAVTRGDMLAGTMELELGKESALDVPEDGMRIRMTMFAGSSWAPPLSVSVERM